MTDAELIKRKLERLVEDLGYLKRSAKYSLDDFLAEPERYGSAERFLQTAIETTIDIGSHIISSENLGTVAAYRDVPMVFRGKNMITEELADAWIAMIGLRNILVHEYGKIDRERLHRFMKTDLDDIERLRDLFLRYL